MNFGRRGGFAAPRGIASARLADLVGPNAVARHERPDGVGLGAEPSLSSGVVLSAQAMARFSGADRRTTGFVCPLDRASMRHALDNPEPHAPRQAPESHAAIEALLMSAEDRGPLMHAHVGMMLALHGAKPIPEYDSSKEKHWGRRKLKRDE
jgi:hypothetical protein